MAQDPMRCDYRQKEAEERAAADASTDLVEREKHLFLAAHYADRARGGPPRRGH